MFYGIFNVSFINNKIFIFIFVYLLLIDVEKRKNVFDRAGTELGCVSHTSYYLRYSLFE